MKIHDYELVKALVVSDLKLRYQGSVAGYLWTLLKPLAIFGVLYIVFNFFVRIGASIENYAMYLLVGVVLWNYFSESTMSGLGVIVDRADLIRKVSFSKILLVVSSGISSFINLLFGLMVVLLFVLLSGIGVGFELVWIIPSIFLLFVVSVSTALILSTLYVRYRDFIHIWELTLQVLFYSTPILYPLSIIPERFVELIMLNPLARIIQLARFSVLGGVVETGENGFKMVVWAMPFIMFGIGLWMFRKQESKMAERV